MATIKADVLADDFEELLDISPTYLMPGTTSWAAIMSGAGCDCSGVFTAAFRKHGADIFHGSNTIARKYLTDREKLTKASQLVVGMAVFKWESAGEPEKYQKDGLGNFHHIGLVASVSPLRIIHQSSSAGHTACDTTIKKWAYCGHLKGVSYDAEDNVPKQEQSQKKEGSGMYKIMIICKKLRIRAEGNTTSAVLGSLPMGTVETASEYTKGWYKLADTDGWVCGEYCHMIEEISDEPEEDDPEDDPEIDDEASEDDVLHDLQRRMDEAEDAIEELRRELDALKGD